MRCVEDIGNATNINNSNSKNTCNIINIEDFVNKLDEKSLDGFFLLLLLLYFQD
jgi:hypothetical protein